MSRKNKLLIFSLLFIILFSVIPYKHQELSLVSKGAQEAAPPEFRIFTPAYLYFFEPFTGLSDYFQSFYNPKKQILSWILWLILIFGVTKMFKNAFKGLIHAAFVLAVFIIVLFALVLFIPSKYRILNDNRNTVLIDFHSHTKSSWDGFANVRRSSVWHKKNGFSFFYITDHSVNKYRDIAGNYNSSESIKALPGEEVADKAGNHLLVLGIETPLPENLINADAEKIVSYVHSCGGAVAVAHWWHKQNSSAEDLLKSGVDAFEIYGHEVTELKPQIQKKIIEFCKRNSLPMLGGTNWHGWGTRNDLWSAVNLEGWQKLTNEKINTKIIENIRRKNTDIFKVLLLKKNEPRNALRIAFEPFTGLFYYFLGLNFLQGLSWCAWLWAGNLIIGRKNRSS